MVDLMALQNRLKTQNAPQANATAETSAPSTGLKEPEKPSGLAALFAKKQTAAEAPQANVRANREEAVDIGEMSQPEVFASKNEMLLVDQQRRQAAPQPEPTLLDSANAASASIPAAQDRSALVPAKVSMGPVAFQDRLDALDGLIATDNSISSLVMDQVRSHVMYIMTELSTYPEYEGMIIDRDVHNVMAFVQQSSMNAGVEFKKKAESRTKKATNQAAISNVDLSGFDAIAQKMAIAAPKPKVDLGALATLNLDSIAPKTKP